MLWYLTSLPVMNTYHLHIHLFNCCLYVCVYREMGWGEWQVLFYARVTFLKTVSQVEDYTPIYNNVFLGVRALTSYCIVYDCTTSGHTDLQSIDVLCIQYIYITIQYTYICIQYIYFQHNKNLRHILSFWQDCGRLATQTLQFLTQHCLYFCQHFYKMYMCYYELI